MKMKKWIASFVCVFFLFQIVPVFAATTAYLKGYTVLGNAKVTEKTTDYTITVPKKILTLEKAFITDQNNKTVSTKHKIVLSSAKTEITVSPKSALLPGTTYRLYIPKAIAGKTKGKYQAMVTPFTTPKKVVTIPPAKPVYVKELKWTTAEGEAKLNLFLHPTVSKVVLETEENQWEEDNTTTGRVLITLTDIKGDNSYSLSLYNSKGQLLEKKTGKTPVVPYPVDPKPPVPNKVISEVETIYSSLLTSFVIYTDDSVFKVIVEYKNQKFEARYTGSSSFDIDIPNVKIGDKAKVTAYGDSDQVLETIEVTVN